MSIRVGESWQARNGHRRFVSMPLHDVLFLGLLGFGFWAFVILPLLFLWWCLLAELWLSAETVLFLVTGVLAVVAVALHGARWSDVTLSRLRWGLFMVDLKGRQ